MIKKQRLGLDTLLKKYQTSSNFYQQKPTNMHYTGFSIRSPQVQKPFQFQKEPISINPKHYATGKLKTKGHSESSTDFFSAKTQCLQNLNNFQQFIKDEQIMLKNELDAYTQQVVNNMLRQNQNIKRQILKIVQQNFQQTKQFIILHAQHQRSKFQQQNHQYFNVFNEPRKQFSILFQGLKSQHYKQAISKVVKLDFQSIKSNTHHKSRELLSKYKQSFQKLNVSEFKLKNIKQNLQNIYVVRQIQKQKSYAPQFIAGRQSRSKRSIFQPRDKFVGTSRESVSVASPKNKERKRFFDFGQ